MEYVISFRIVKRYEVKELFKNILKYVGTLNLCKI